MDFFITVAPTLFVIGLLALFIRAGNDWVNKG